MPSISFAAWDDTAGIGDVVDDYRRPDSLLFSHGTDDYVDAWEHNLHACYGMDDYTSGAASDGDTTVDDANSYHGRISVSTSVSWAAGKWGDNDGTVDKIGSGSYRVSSNSADFEIGGGYDGVIDDVRFYTEALSAAAIRSIAVGGYDPGAGVYTIRADADGTTDFYLDGTGYKRRYPLFRVSNYWSTSQPRGASQQRLGYTETGPSPSQSTEKVFPLFQPIFTHE